MLPAVLPIINILQVVYQLLYHQLQQLCHQHYHLVPEPLPQLVQGILALSGMTDPDVKPILYCFCTDKSVHLYELPILFAKQEIQTLQMGPAGLFFTGDQTGLLTEYTWLAD
uniref:Uncharacterized protein n=1 Tax=Quercus lobata TaxID=97700 RepID=A0A7N2R3N3_QUELO